MGRPWEIIELGEDDIRDIGWEELPGRPYDLQEDAFQNFFVDHEQYGFIGKADIQELEEYGFLRGAQIIEDRQALRYKDNGESHSPFGDLIEARLEKLEGKPVRTDAVTDHGKTQYKMEQYGFRPTRIDPVLTSERKPHIEMWKGDFGTEAVHLTQDYEDALKEILGDSINIISGGGERSGLDYERLKTAPEIDESLTLYKLQRGNKDPEQVVDEILARDKIDRDSYAVEVVGNTRYPEMEDVVEGLRSEFGLFGFRPPYGSNGTEVYLGKFNEEIPGVEVTDQNIDFLEKLGLETSIESESEKSSKLTLLP